MDELLKNQALIMLAAASKRLPYVLVGGRPRLVVPGLRTFTKVLSVTGSSEVYFDAKNSKDLLLHHIVARCSDATGLAACRFALKDDQGNFLSVEREHSEVGTQTAPLLNVMAVSSADAMDERPSLGLLMPGNVTRRWSVTNVNGTPTYTVELTAVYEYLS